MSNPYKSFKEKVLQILQEQAATIDPPGLMLQKFARENDKPLEFVKTLIEEVLKGIDDNI